MTRIDLARASITERLLEGHVDEAHFQTLRANDLGRGGVLGDLRAERTNAAGALQHLAAPHHILALREAKADGLRAILPARLEGIQKGAFHLGPEALGREPIGMEMTRPVSARKPANMV